MKSLRTRLQLWHALVLVAVLASFGVFVSMLSWRTRMQQIDAELDRTSGIVFSQLRRLVPPPPHFHRPGGHRGPGGGPNNANQPNGPTANRQPDNQVADEQQLVSTTVVPEVVAPEAIATDANPPRAEGRSIPREPVEWDSPLEDQPIQDRPMGDHPRRDGRGMHEPGPPREPPPQGSPQWGRFWRDNAEATKEFERLFDGEGDSPLYFVIWNNNGERLQKSASAPDVPFPGLRRGENSILPVRVARTRDDRRELVSVAWFDMNILVGRSLARDIADQRAVNAWLALAGCGVLAVGLVGGLWLSRRALLPIEIMTSTAQKISASNLSERLDLSRTDSELGTLADVLNDTFARLETAFVQQTRFTADASHELRTPLAVILANVELALARPRSSEEYRETLQTCLRASHRMKGLIDNLLILARFDSGDPELQIGPVSLETLIEDCVDLVKPLADQRHIAIQAEISPLVISADYDRLEQVITNLLSNAIRYNRDGGRIDIVVAWQERSVSISVTDTGIGLPPESIPHVFERFFRVDKARSRAEGGTGLGLAICRSIIEAHGGTISVRSDGSTGSTFEVRLPHEAQVDKAAEAKGTERAESYAGALSSPTLAPGAGG